MTQQHTLELAKQGDIKSIEALINELLKPKGITAKVGLKDSCLYVAIAAAKIPEKQALVKLIGKQILGWGIESFQTAKICAAEWGQSLPVWQQEIPLGSVRLSALKNQVPFPQPPTNQTYLSHQIQAGDVDKEINGQLQVGKRAIELDSPYGSVISIEMGDNYRVQPRPHPIALLPDGFPHLIGRLMEIKGALTALESKQSIEFYGSYGLGKSVLLRHLTYFTQNQGFADGVVYFNKRHQPVGDLLQSLFDIFYESDISYKPTDEDICQALQGKEFLILLDDKKLTSEHIKQLQKALPCTRLGLASPQKRLPEGQFTTQLEGLKVRDGLTFLTQQLQQPISPEDSLATEALTNLLEGNPWLLLLAVTGINKGVFTLAELVLKLQPPATPQVLIQRVLAVLPKSHQAILAIFAALDGVALVTAQVEVLSGINESKNSLESLVEWNLVETEPLDAKQPIAGHRYRINDALVTALQDEWDLTPWRERAMAYFITWAEQYRSLPSLLCSEADGLLEILAWGVEAKRWEDVLRLAKMIEIPLALGKRWGLWQQVLEYGLNASLALNDKYSEAWMLHQLGSRALCLEQMKASQNYLTRALKIREALGSESLAAATRQNLALVTKSKSKEQTQEPQIIVNTTPANAKIQLITVALIILLCSGVAGFLAWYVLLRPKSSPTPKPTTTSNPTPKFNQIDLAQINISRPSLDFGQQPINSESKKQTITVTNNASMSVRIGRIDRVGAQGDFDITSTTCASTVPPNATCDISIIFSPIDVGKHRATLPVSDSDGKTIKQLLIRGIAITEQPNLDSIAPAPPKRTEEPLELPKSTLISPVSSPKIKKAPVPKIEAPAPVVKESPDSSVTESPEFTPTPEATATPSDSSEPTPTQSVSEEASEETTPTPVTTPGN